MEEMMKSVAEEMKSALKNSGGAALAWFGKISPPETSSEKINHLHQALRNAGGEAVARCRKIFPPETRAAVSDQISHYLLAVKSSGVEAVAWFDKIFPPETRAEKISHWIHVAKPYAPYVIAAVFLAVVVRFSRGGGGGMGKTMKAPGRNYRMPRHNFEINPKGYFSDLRRHR